MAFLNLETVENIIRKEAIKPIGERQTENFGESIEHIQTSILRFILQSMKPELWTEKGEELIIYFRIRTQNGSDVNDETTQNLRREEALMRLIDEEKLLIVPKYMEERRNNIDAEFFFARLKALADYTRGADLEDFR